MEKLSQLKILEESRLLKNLTKGDWITGLYTSAKLLGYYKGNTEEVYLISPNYEGAIEIDGTKINILKPVSDFEYKFVDRLQTKEALFIGLMIREPFLMNTEYEICQRILWKEKNIDSFVEHVQPHIPRNIWNDNSDDLIQTNNF